MGKTTLWIACILLLTYVYVIQAIPGGGDGGNDFKTSGRRGRGNKEQEKKVVQVSENDLVEMILIYEEKNPDLTVLPTADKIPLIPDEWQGNFMKLRDRLTGVKNNWLEKNLPQRSEKEMRDDLRKLAGRCLALGRQMLQEAQSIANNAEQLRTKTMQLKSILQKVAKMSPEEINQMAVDQLNKINNLKQRYKEKTAFLIQQSPGVVSEFLSRRLPFNVNIEPKQLAQTQAKQDAAGAREKKPGDDGSNVAA